MGGGQSTSATNATLDDKELLKTITTKIETNIEQINKTIKKVSTNIINEYISNSSSENTLKCSININNLKAKKNITISKVNQKNLIDVKIESTLTALSDNKFTNDLKSELSTNNTDISKLINDIQDNLKKAVSQKADSESTGQNTPLAGNSANSLNLTYEKTKIDEKIINDIITNLKNENIIDETINNTMRNSQEQTCIQRNDNSLTIDISNLETDENIDINNITQENIVTSLLSCKGINTIGSTMADNTGLSGFIKQIKDIASDNKSSTKSESKVEQTASAISTGAFTAAVIIILIIVGGIIYYFVNKNKNPPIEQVAGGFKFFNNICYFLNKNKLLLGILVLLFLLYEHTNNKLEHFTKDDVDKLQNFGDIFNAMTKDNIFKVPGDITNNGNINVKKNANIDGIINVKNNVNIDGFINVKNNENIGYNIFIPDANTKISNRGIIFGGQNLSNEEYSGSININDKSLDIRGIKDINNKDKNHVVKISEELNVAKKICIGDTCINEDNLKVLNGTKTVFIQHQDGSTLDNRFTDWADYKRFAGFTTHDFGEWQKMKLVTI